MNALADRINVNVKSIEVDKPTGGGKGPDVAYVVDVIIDGRLALVLQRWHFREPGQMAAFIEILSGGKLKV